MTKKYDVRAREEEVRGKMTMGSRMRSCRSLFMYCRLAETHRKVYSVCLLVALYISTLIVGSIYTFGNLQPYLVSYIRIKSRPSDLRYTQSTYLYSAQYAGNAIGFTLASSLESLLGLRVSYLIGGLLFSCGLILSYFSVQHSYYLLFPTFSIMYSFGSGVFYMVPVLSATRWFPKRSGLAVGFVISAIGLGGLAFSALQTGFINQNDSFPDEAPYPENPDEKYFTQPDLIDRFPYIFLIEGIIALVVTCGGVLVISDPKPIEKESNNIDDSNNNDNRSFSCIINYKAFQEILSRPGFYMHWTVALLNVLGFGVIASLFKTYGLEVLKSSDYFLTALGGVASGLFNTVGRGLFGFLADKIGYQPAYVFQGGFMAFLLLTLYITSLGYPIMYFVWVCLMYFCYGGFATLGTIAIFQAFGEKNFNINYPLMATTSQTVASFLYGIISDFCVDNLDWSGTFLLIGSLTFIQMLLIIAFPANNPTGGKQYPRKFWSVLEPLNVK